jgi:hypothetical protein
VLNLQKILQVCSSAIADYRRQTDLYRGIGGGICPSAMSSFEPALEGQEG